MTNIVVKSVVSNKNAIHSGIVHLDGEEQFRIEINGWSCLVNFLTDDKGARYSGEVVDGMYNINLYNHVNVIGESITKPFIIAQMDGKPIWMTYLTNVISPAAKVRRFEYVLWMEV